MGVWYGCHEVGPVWACGMGAMRLAPYGGVVWVP